MNILKQTIRRIKASLFLQNVATLATGTTLAQAVSILTAPILYRIYDKEDYGTLGLYMAIVGIIGVFSTMQYNHAILLEKEDESAKNVMWLNRLVNMGVSIITFAVILLFNEQIANVLGNQNLAPWLYFAPISIFFSGQAKILSVWANRKKKYKLLATNTITTALSIPLISITIGVFNNGPMGLFFGLIFSHIFQPTFLFILLNKKDSFGFKYFNWIEMKTKIIEYKNLPIYSLPTEFIDRSINQLPILMLSAFSGPAAVGIFNLCTRMLGIPLQIIGRAISQVFRQRAVEDFKTNGDFNQIYVKTLKTLIVASIPGFLIISFFGPQLFSIVFGKEWIESGEIAQIMIVMFVLSLITSPLSYAYFIRDKLREDMLVHSYILVSMLAIFFIGFWLFEDYKSVILLYTINYSIVYLFYLYRSYNFSRK